MGGITQLTLGGGPLPPGPATALTGALTLAGCAAAAASAPGTGTAGAGDAAHGGELELKLTHGTFRLNIAAKD